MHPSMDSGTGDKTSTDVSTGQEPVLNPTSSDIVDKYQEMFASRYSDDDSFFKPYKNKGMDPPPIVENYFMRQQKRSWNDSNRDQRNYYDRGHSQGYPSKRPHYDHGSHHHGGWHQQGRNQQWGHTSHNQDWRQPDRPGYGSQPQRDQRDRFSDGRHDRRSNEKRDERHHHDSRYPSQGRNSGHQPHDEWT